MKAVLASTEFSIFTIPGLMNFLLNSSHDLNSHETCSVV